MNSKLTVSGALGRALLAGLQGVRLGRLLLGALLMLGVPALSRAAENTAAPPTMPPLPLIASLRDLLKTARTDPPTRETITGLKELIPAVPDERVRERLTCAVAMGLRYGGDLEGFSQLSKDMRTRYPESSLLPSLEDEAFEAVCTVCDGKGGTQRTCEKCGGRRTCTNSKCEVGKIRYKGSKGWEEKPCPICKGLGQCPVCKGVGTLTDPCAACKGKGRRETKARDREVFLSALDGVQAALDLPAATPVAPTTPTTTATPATPATPAVAPPKETAPATGNTEVTGPGTTPSPSPGSGKTPEYLLPLVKEYRAWLTAMQTRAGMPVATRIRAEDETDRAVLHVVVTRELLRQPRDKRTQTLEALRGMWAEKVASHRFNGRRMAAATVFEDDAGKVVHEAE